MVRFTFVCETSVDGGEYSEHLYEDEVEIEGNGEADVRMVECVLWNRLRRGH